LTSDFRASAKPAGTAAKEAGLNVGQNVIQGTVEGTAGWGMGRWWIDQQKEIKGTGVKSWFKDFFDPVRANKKGASWLSKGPIGKAFRWLFELQTAKERVLKRTKKGGQVEMDFADPGKKRGWFTRNGIRIAKMFFAVAILGFATMVAKAAIFAFQTGLGFKNMVNLGPAILINKKYVEAMAEEFGTINDVSAKTAWILKVQELKYGIQSDQAVKILRIQTAISDKTNDQLIAIQKQVAQQARLAGVLPAKLFEDIAQNMEYFAKTAKDGGKNVMMTALAAKQLGLNLGVVDQIATHLLDMEGSIAAQFEASAVIGRELNLDRARQLSLLGKDAEMMEEIVRLVGGEAEFNKMNRVHRDLLSKAIGTDVSNVAKMVTEEERATKAVAAQKNQWIAIGGIVLGIVGAFVGAIPGLGALSWGKMATGAVIGTGIGMGIGSAVGSKLPSFQGLPPGVGAKIQTGGAMAHGGETIVRTESINMDGLLTEIKGLRKDLNKGQGRIYRGLEELG
jgi:hypothetical protein